MDDKQKSGNMTFSHVSGQVIIGDHNQQNRIVNAGPAQISEAERAALEQILADLKEQIRAEAPPDKQAAALERAEELGEAITGEAPDLDTIAYVRRWFAKNLPALAGAVTGIIIHPIVGKLVEAAGDLLASEFRRRFGGEPSG